MKDPEASEDAERSLVYFLSVNAIDGFLEGTQEGRMCDFSQSLRNLIPLIEAYVHEKYSSKAIKVVDNSGTNRESGLWWDRYGDEDYSRLPLLRPEADRIYFDQMEYDVVRNVWMAHLDDWIGWVPKDGTTDECTL